MGSSKPITNDELPPCFELQTVFQLQITGTSFIRISELKASSQYSIPSTPSVPAATKAKKAEK
jgi:hypothetical protein